MRKAIDEGYANKLEVPKGARDVQVFDTELPGFGIRKFAPSRKHPKGYACYFVKFNVGPQQRRKVLGKVVRGNLKTMRLEASNVLAKARLGVDTVAEQRRLAAKVTNTLGELLPRYLIERETGAWQDRKLRPRTLIEVKRYLENAWKPLHRIAVDAVTLDNIKDVIEAIETSSGRVAADRARTTLSTFFAWSIHRRHTNSNPAANIDASSKAATRTRTLAKGEIVEIWKACDDDDYGRIIKLLLLTGQRRTEVGDLRWTEVSITARQIELPPERVKNGRSHLIPLSDEALTIIEAVPRRDRRDLLFGAGSGGFSGWSKGKAQLDKLIADKRDEHGDKQPMPSWVVHDLRRTVATSLRELRFADTHLVELILNHVSGTRSGVAGTYDRSERLEERRQALQLWGEHVAALVAGREAKVVPLKRA